MGGDELFCQLLCMLAQFQATSLSTSADVGVDIGTDTDGDHPRLSNRPKDVSSPLINAPVVNLSLKPTTLSPEPQSKP